MLHSPFYHESVTDRPTDGQTDKPSYRDARTHLKMLIAAGFGQSLSFTSDKLDLCVNDTS